MNPVERQALREIRRKVPKKNRKPVAKATFEKDKLPYVLMRTYEPDISLDWTVGTRKMILEVKGYLRPADRAKMIAVKKMHPDLDIRFIFMKDNKLSKRSKTKYSDWCKKHGFPYCFLGNIPKEWFQ